MTFIRVISALLVVAIATAVRAPSGFQQWGGKRWGSAAVPAGRFHPQFMDNGPDFPDFNRPDFPDFNRPDFQDFPGDACLEYPMCPQCADPTSSWMCEMDPSDAWGGPSAWGMPRRSFEFDPSDRWRNAMAMSHHRWGAAGPSRWIGAAPGGYAAAGFGRRPSFQMANPLRGVFC